MSWFETVILYVSVIEYVLFKNHLEKLIIFLPFPLGSGLAGSPLLFLHFFRRNSLNVLFLLIVLFSPF